MRVSERCSCGASFEAEVVRVYIDRSQSFDIEVPRETIEMVNPWEELSKMQEKWRAEHQCKGRRDDS